MLPFSTLISCLKSGAAIPQVPASLKMWIDPSDQSTLSLSGSTVNSATCKVTGTVFSAPIGGLNSPLLSAAGDPFLLPGLDFGQSGITKFLSSASGVAVSVEHTVFMVVRWGSYSSTYSSLGILSGSGSNAINGATGYPSCFIYTSNNSVGVAQIHNYHLGSLAYYYSSNGVARNSSAVLEFKSNDTANNSFTNLNGTQLTKNAGSTGTFSTSPSYRCIGSSDSLYRPNGVIGEIRVYDGTLTAAEATAINSQLMTKWLGL